MTVKIRNIGVFHANVMRGSPMVVARDDVGVARCPGDGVLRVAALVGDVVAGVDEIALDAQRIAINFQSQVALPLNSINPHTGNNTN